MRTTTVEDPSVVHACAVPASEEELWEVSAAFLADGLAAGEQVVYFDDGTADAVLGRLVDDRVPVDGPLRDGRLRVVETEVTRAAMRIPLHEAASGFAALIDDALGAGFPGIRWTGQYSSRLRPHAGLWLADYDAAMERALVGRPARALCLYDRTRYPDDVIEVMRGLHDVQVESPALYDDSLLRVTRVRPFRLRLAGEVDHSNRPVLNRLVAATLDEALRGHDSPAVLELDLSSLRFLDVAGAVALVHAAEEFPQSHRLALSGVRPGVQRVLDRCGAPFAAQLDVTPHPGSRCPGFPLPPPADPPDGAA